MASDYFRVFARYNRWANTRLYDACAQLSDADRRQDRKAFFGSVHNTLNHLLVGDRIWMGRFTGTDSGIKALNQILFDDFAALRRAREMEDDRIQVYVEGCDEAKLAAALDFKSMDGTASSMPLAQVLGHFFNHQTHHRGQVHAMLSQAGVAAPSLDLIAFLREKR
ncbi:MAG: DinB family protein [Alphaproteobacteria bacterium]